MQAEAGAYLTEGNTRHCEIRPKIHDLLHGFSEVYYAGDDYGSGTASRHK